MNQLLPSLASEPLDVVASNIRQLMGGRIYIATSNSAPFPSKQTTDLIRSLRGADIEVLLDPTTLP